MRPDARHLTAELARHGVTDWTVERGGKHPRVVFTWQGVRRIYVFPATPGDQRGARNAVADLRRLLGVTRVVRKSGRVKRRTRRVEQVPPMPEGFLVAADPWEALRDWGRSE